MRRSPAKLMNSHSFLYNITKGNPLSRSEFTSCGDYRNASIACIMRLAPPSWAAMGKVAPLPPKFDSIEGILEHMEVHGQTSGMSGRESPPDAGLEILFIKRSMRPGDQWGGHVAWPGGFLNHEEDAVSGVQREVKEELGIDLSTDDNYTHLGAMNPTKFGPSHKGLHPHVFMKMNIETPDFILEEKEVDAVRWISARHFLRCTTPSALHTHTVHAENVIPFRGWSKKVTVAIARLLGLDEWHFPCVRLPADSVHAFTGNYEKDSDWVVWGLTFNTIRRLLRHANGNKEYISLSTPYRTNSSVFNALVTYFYKYYSDLYESKQSEANPDTDPNLHRKILLSSVGGLAGVYMASAAVGLGAYVASTTVITNALSHTM